jgi:hypothetical protein
MRRIVVVLVLVGWSSIALADDPHAEMAAALVAAADLHPAPAALPVATATKTASAPGGKKVPPQANLGRSAADQAQQGQSQAAASIARNAQAAAMSAAGQAQAAAAKLRSAHNPH